MQVLSRRNGDLQFRSIAMKTYQAPTGQSFAQAFNNARAISTEHLEPVTLTYADIPVVVWPDSTLQQTLNLWRMVSRLHLKSMAAA